MRNIMYRLWQFVKVVLGTTLIDGTLTGTYLAIVKGKPDYMVVRILWAFAYDIWFILALGLLLVGLSRLFPRYISSLPGQLVLGGCIGGLMPNLIDPQIASMAAVETVLFAVVGCGWGYLYWRLISNSAMAKA